MKFSLKNPVLKHLRWICFLSFLFSLTNSQAVTRYWIGGASNAWNNSANWGTASGTGAPASVPSITDVAIFDGGSVGACNLTSTVTIASLSLTSAFVQTLNLGVFNFSVTGNSLWSGGTFAGGSAIINNGGTFNLSGTNFTSTSGTLTIAGAFSFVSGSFNHNNGTVKFANNNFSISGSPVFYHLGFISNYNTLTFSSSFTVAGNMTIGSSNSASTIYSISPGQSIDVNGTLYLTGNTLSSINSGIINAKGDIMINSTSSFAGGTGTINIVGTGNQLLTGSGVFNQGNLPSVIINKPSGTLNLSGYITVTGPSWKYVSGILAAGTSTVCFFNTSVPYTISGTHTLNKVIFYGNYSTYTINNDLTANDITMDASLSCDVKVNSTMTANGTLLITGPGYYKINTGIVYAKGNIINNNTNVVTGGGTGSFVINGSGNQVLVGSSGVNQGTLPPFIINKPSGLLFLTGYINFFYGFTWLAGLVDAGTSTCVFGNIAALGSQMVTAPASDISFYNVIFDQPDYVWTQLKTDINVAGSLTITPGSGIQTNSHTIFLAGNFTSLNTSATGSSYVFNGVTRCSVVLTGSGPASQNITTNNPSGLINRALFYNLTLNNTASRATNDDVILNDILNISNSITFTSGKLVSALSNFLFLKDGATTNTGNKNSYVNGSMRYEMAFAGSRLLNFPIGEKGNWRYIQLNLTHNNTTSYTYVSSITKSSAASLNYPFPPSINKVSDLWYVEIGRIVTSSGSDSNLGLSGNQTIVMSYDTSDMVTDFTNLTVAKTYTDGVTWIDIGGIASGNTTGTIISTSTPSAFTSFSRFTLANRPGGINPLPIELIDFTAFSCEENVCVKWTTASEKNNSFFTVEKSENGIDFKPVGNVPGGNTSASRLSYSLEDPNPFEGISYYRLKQTDTDGKSEYFRIVSVDPTSAINDIRIYPNPNAGGKFTLETKNPPKQLSLYDSFGANISTLKISAQQTELDLSYLLPGIYYLMDRATGINTKLVINK